MSYQLRNIKATIPLNEATPEAREVVPAKTPKAPKSTSTYILNLASLIILNM